MNYYIPQWEERTSYGFRRIDPYAKLFEDRIIYLGTPISDDVANAVIAQLMCLESMNPDQDVGKRTALPNSRILIHQPYTEGTFGQTSDIEIQANEILRMRELLEQMISDHSGRDREQVSRDIERDKILTAEQAVEYGLIDAVIQPRKGTPALT
jgi:ATP-dependent Clp protease protease subunit